MKLVEILARDLPTRGGWPQEMRYFVQDGDGEIKPGKYSSEVQRVENVWLRGENISSVMAFMAEKAEDWENAIVTREIYEKFIFTQGQPMWNGKGIPPVGYVCEFSYLGGDWTRGEIKYASIHTVVIDTEESFEGELEPCFPPRDLEFRPVQTEEDKAKEQTIEAISQCLSRYHVIDTRASAEGLYKTMQEGKIRGVSLEVKP